MALNSAQLIGTGLLDGFRNRIINGDMRIAQRGVPQTLSASGYVIDRWNNGVSGGGAYSVNQSTDVPTTAQAGTAFTNSMLVTVTTADSSIAAGDFYWPLQRIEGYNFSDMGFGGSSASAVTVSFWVKSSLTGTYGLGFTNTAASRSYATTYAINAANTWEYKTVTVPGDTGGTWPTDNSGAFQVVFLLGSGSNFAASTANTWTATTNNIALSAATRSTSTASAFIANLGATFYVTRVQIEKGSVATEFERRAYGAELGLCQRYYQQSFVGNSANTTSGAKVFMTPGASTVCYGHLNYPVVMRDTPTVTIFNPVGGAAAAMRNLELAASYAVGGISFDNSTGFGRISGTASISSAAQGMQFHYTASIEL